MFERADRHYTPVDSGLTCNMKSAYKLSKTMQAAAAKEKQGAKAMYSILDNSKTVWSLVNTNNEQVDHAKSGHENILSQAYSANTITAKNVPTSFSSTTITVTSPATTETTTAAHSLASSTLSSTITVTSTIMIESPSSSQVTDDEVAVSVKKRKRKQMNITNMFAKKKNISGIEFASHISNMFMYVAM